MTEAIDAAALAPQNGSALGFSVVGVGASAGGLEAFTELVRSLPPKPGMAFVLIQHLDPNHASLLPEILGRETSMPVAQASDDQRVEKDHIYVIPPNTHLTIRGGHLRLTPRVEPPGVFMPIDDFLRSLAKDQGGRSVAVILSGGGTDGALGLGEVKAAEGVTFAQSEKSAKFDSMPRSAIWTGAVDFVLAPAQIAVELVRVNQELRGEPESEEEADNLQAVFALLRKSTGVDFAQYKQNTMRRRVQRRMALLSVPSVAEYVALLRERPVELEALYHDLLIRVTSFFRDPAAFATLQETVLPALVKDRPLGTPIRVWVAGCSTGEEVYSLAIALVESLGDRTNNTPIKILATDVNEAALERARAGTYIDNIALDVSPERLRRFFVQVNGNYQVSKSIRDLCVFSRHNLVQDTPFANLDLVSCRNVLIYLDAPLQKRVFPLFHYALKPAGFLFLGGAETVGTFTNLFAVVDKESRVFSRRDTAARAILDVVLRESPGRDMRRGIEVGAEVAAPAVTAADVQRDVDRVLLSRYVPAGVVIDEDMTILSFRGQAGRYLNPAQGTATLDLMRMVREGLATDLKAAVAAAKSQNVTIRRERVPVRENTHIRSVNIEVVPVRPRQTGARFFLVLFTEAGESVPVAADVPGGVAIEEPALLLQIRRLESELAASREYLQSVVEQNEAASEELKSANEETLSSNEELQSTNEELQTAKEEMQSTNEELTTVNEELQHRNGELKQLYDDLVNLLGGLDIPIIMVSREMRIRRFTPPAEDLFNLIAADVGRPIGNLRPKLNVPDLEVLIEEVIQTPATKTVEVQDTDGRWHLLRVRPYVTADNKIEGAAIAALDIDVMKRSAELLKASRDYADAIVETVWEPLLVLDGEFRVRRANAAFYRTFNVARDQTEGCLLVELQEGRWCDPKVLDFLRAAVANSGRARVLDLEVELPELGVRDMQLTARRILWPSGDSGMTLLAINDVTERTREIETTKLLAREQAARAEAERANRMKDEFLAMLAHELRNPLAPVRNTLEILRQRTPADPVVQRALALSQRQVSHMARLLDDLLDVSRITRSQVQLRIEIVELTPSLEKSIEACRHLIDSKNHNFTFILPKEAVYLEADPARLEQIVSNLLNNAAKYTDPGGELLLTAEPDGEQILIRVKDSGVGIAPEMLPRVFDLFAQAERTLDRSQGGLGIGLTLVKRLVELHGGSVSVTSDGAGRGSEFVVRLPQLPRQKAGPDDAAVPNLEQAKHRILIVDDNDDAAETLAEVLRMLGHTVETAHDGPAALRAAAALVPAFVLLDIGLPGMSGYDVARKLRSEAALADAVLVALTGYGQEDDQARARAAGFDHHLVKPAALADITRILTSRK